MLPRQFRFDIVMPGEGRISTSFVGRKQSRGYPAFAGHDGGEITVIVRQVMMSVLGPSFGRCHQRSTRPTSKN